MKFLFFFFIMLIMSCGKRPGPLITKYTDSISGQGLWLTMRTGISGRLSRLDQATLQETKIAHNKIFSDAILVPGENNELFMLTRMNSDSIQVLTGIQGQLTSEIPLPRGDFSDRYPVSYNPQYAIRDHFNRIWVVGQNSNTIHIYQNTRIVGEIALDNKHNDYAVKPDGSDYYLEPAILIAPNDDEIIIIAQRLRRYFEGGWDWVPSEESAMIVINQKTLKIRTIKYLPVSNPIKAFVDYNGSWPIITVVGAGSLNDYPLFGSTAKILSKDYSLLTHKNFSFKILDADINQKGNLALIAWHKEQEYSCILFDEREVSCQNGEQGYVFNKIAVADDEIFVSIAKEGSGYLMKINASSYEQKIIPTRGLIESMVIGI